MKYIEKCPILVVLGVVYLLTITASDNGFNGSPIKLIDEPKCSKIGYWCKDLRDGDDDFVVLECLQSISTNDIVELKRECQPIIRSHIEKIIENQNVHDILYDKCGREIESFGCKVTSNNGEFLACILDNREEIKSDICHRELQRFESVAFFDLPWVTQFLQACKGDMEHLQCNKRETNRDFLFKGQVLTCLQSNLKGLDSRCRTQVLRLTEIQADNIKLDPELYTACASDRLRYCREFQPGTGFVFKCLMQNRLDMSEKCQAQLLKRQKLIIQDFKINKGMMRACREDIKKSHCRKQISSDKTIRLAQILLCLENYVHNGTTVSSACEGEMIDQRKILMEDYRLSPEIVDSCSEDIKNFCDTAVTGRTIHCLMQHARISQNSRISDKCQRALEDLIKEADAGENWRVDPVLREACQAVVDRACKGVRGGDARVMSCLMDKLGTDKMNTECENALVQIQYFVARDFKLDPQLYRSCRSDAIKFCHAQKTWAHDYSYNTENSPLVLPCLYRYAYHEERGMRLEQTCLDQIRRVMRQRAISVDLQPEIEEKCIEELSLYCFDKTEKGEEILCLQTHLSDLKETCRLSVANFTEEQAQHVELNPIIMTHCAVIIDRHCKLKRDEGDVMECLIMHKNDPDVKADSKCRASVEHFQLISLKNYHFTYKFKLACKPFVMRFCQDSRTKADVIACLSETVRNDTLLDNRNRITKDCRQQIRAQLLQQRENIDFDVKLKKACNEDINRFCKDKPHGSSLVLECLKSEDDLSENCKKQIFKIRTQDMIDNSIDYTLVTMCQSMIKQFCGNYDPGRILDCLRINKDNDKFDNHCKHVVIHRLIEQNRDYRFNPKLQNKCGKEIDKFCSDMLKPELLDHELEGQVTKCLKKQFRKGKLSHECEVEMTNILREQALNYQLNPLLKAICSQEIQTICKTDKHIDESDGKTEECLKNAFTMKRAPITPACRTEIAVLIEEAKADIHVDPLLQRACSLDLLRYCSEVQQGGGKLLKCLQVTMNELNKPMEPKCTSMLKSRMEMFKNAADALKLDNFGQLYSQVVASPARRYFLITSFTVIGLIFFAGMFCGSMTRKARVLKNK